MGWLKNFYPRKVPERFQQNNYRTGRVIFGVIIYGMIDTIEKTGSEWSVTAENIMFELIRRGEPFSADSFYTLAVKASMPASLIKKFSGAMFKSYYSAGYLKKRKDYVISSRNGGAVLPLWESAGGK